MYGIAKVVSDGTSMMNGGLNKNSRRAILGQSVGSLNIVQPTLSLHLHTLRWFSVLTHGTSRFQRYQRHHIASGGQTRHYDSRSDFHRHHACNGSHVYSQVSFVRIVTLV